MLIDQNATEYRLGIFMDAGSRREDRHMKARTTHELAKAIALAFTRYGAQKVRVETKCTRNWGQTWWNSETRTYFDQESRSPYGRVWR